MNGSYEKAVKFQNLTTYIRKYEFHSNKVSRWIFENE